MYLLNSYGTEFYTNAGEWFAGVLDDKSKG
jgi:hypothetical protein